MVNEINMFVCPDCETRLKRAKRTVSGLVRSCPNGCGFWLLYQKKWYSQKDEW